MSSIIACQRNRFDIPKKITYMNCAYLSPLHQSVRDAGNLGVARKAAPWDIKPAHFFNESQELRVLFARLIGSAASDIALVPSVSYGIGIAAANLPLEAGQNIVVLDEQFPSNYYPWKARADRSGAEMRITPRPDDGNWAAGVLKLMDSKTAVVALPNCHWTDGSLVDLEKISDECRLQGIPLVLDLTQSLGAMPFDISRIKPAFMVSAGYKWMLGPYGLAYVYVAPEYQNGIPLEYNWITRDGSEDFAGLVDYEDRLSPGATRFDMGERSNFHLHPMGKAALNLLLGWGVENISATLSKYNDQLIERAAALGFETIPKEHRSPHLLGLRYPGKLPSSLAAELSHHHIFVSVRGDAVRVSPHLYNNQTDRERMFSAMDSLL